MSLTAKKLSPGKVEDQENAAVARPTNKRSADALLTPSAVVKTDPEITLAKVRMKYTITVQVTVGLPRDVYSNDAWCQEACQEGTPLMLKFSLDVDVEQYG